MLRTLTVAWVAALVVLAVAPRQADAKLKVVATTSTYADIAKHIGGDMITIKHIANATEDVHFVRPKPSYAQMVAEADVLVATGLDLEMWLPSLIDKAGNAKVKEGQKGYVAVHYGIDKIEVPASADKSAGDIHVYGNPHLHTSPLNAKKIAKNIAVGLIKNDPANEAYYKDNLKKFQTKIDERLFGKELVAILGSKTLTKLAVKGKLVKFLQKKQYKGAPLIDKLGGWMKKTLPLYGTKVVTYHKNWGYLFEILGLETVGFIEIKPGIPPSPNDIATIVGIMKKQSVKLFFTANFYDNKKISRVSEKVGVDPVVVPFDVGGTAQAKDYFALVDLWIDALVKKAK